MKNNKSKEFLITVYLVCHNYEEYVEQAINSVLAQTYKNFELIIIDDGSTDNSKDVINRYVKYPNVRIILQENKGLIATNNVAIRAATGKYVMRLDADDYLDESALLVLVNAIEESEDIALVFPDYYYIDRHGNITGQEKILEPRSNIYKKHAERLTSQIYLFWQYCQFEVPQLIKIAKFLKHWVENL